MIFSYWNLDIVKAESTNRQHWTPVQRHFYKLHRNVNVKKFQFRTRTSRSRLQLLTDISLARPSNLTTLFLPKIFYGSIKDFRVLPLEDFAVTYWWGSSFMKNIFRLFSRRRSPMHRTESAKKHRVRKGRSSKFFENDCPNLTSLMVWRYTLLTTTLIILNWPTVYFKRCTCFGRYAATYPGGIRRMNGPLNSWLTNSISSLTFSIQSVITN